MRRILYSVAFLFVVLGGVTAAGADDPAPPAVPAAGNELLGAVERGDVDAVKRLLDGPAKAQLSVRGPKGDTPLIRALCNRSMRPEEHATLVRLLLDSGADVRQTNANGCAPIEFAGVAAAKLLIAKGARWGHHRLKLNGGVNDRYCRYPLWDAAEKGDVAAMTMWLAAGASLKDENDPTNGTPLHAAAGAGQVGAAQFLLARGAKTWVNTRCSWTSATPLHEAIRARADNARKLAMVKLLVENGANVNTRIAKKPSGKPTAFDGPTPLALAKERKASPELVAFLRSKGAR